jgi:VIT1/CCC1 family predicted Fe2+/Mn2+ transporter
MGNITEIVRHTAYLEDERNSSLLYEKLAEIEPNPNLAQFYRRLSETERHHAETWARKIREAGGSVPPFRPTWRTRVLIWLARRFGVQAVLPSISSLEDVGSKGYSSQAEAQELAGTEQSHARLLRQISQSGKGGMEGGALVQIEGRHRTPGGNALRAAVLGASDGLLSNTSLVMGVVGAGIGSRNILLTGLAGLLAGAISMALGEWLSVQSSRELYENQIRTEKEEIESSPEEETEELALIYQARGLSEESARKLSKEILSNRESAIQTLAREELGIDPGELGGSAWEAAITSFVLFAMGAVLPVIAFTFLEGLPAIVLSLLLSTAGLFVIGASITLFTGRSVIYSGMRQVLFGLAAAAATFVIGRLVGVTLGG